MLSYAPLTQLSHDLSEPGAGEGRTSHLSGLTYEGKEEKLLFSLLFLRKSQLHNVISIIYDFTWSHLMPVQRHRESDGPLQTKGRGHLAHSGALREEDTIPKGSLLTTWTEGEKENGRREEYSSEAVNLTREATGKTGPRVWREMTRRITSAQPVDPYRNKRDRIRSNRSLTLSEAGVR